MTPPDTPWNVKKKFFKKSKNTENWQKNGENFKILTSSEGKKFKFYVLDFIYKKKIGGYFLKKTPFSTFEGLLGLNWEIFFGGLIHPKVSA